MFTKFRSNRKNKLIYQTIKTYIIFFCFLLLLNWFIADEIYLVNTILFALWMTGGCFIPILLALIIVKPVTNQESAAKRIKAFKDHHIAVKLICSLTVCIGLIFMLLWLMVPFFGLTFGQAIGASLGIGFLFATLSMLIVRYIIQLEKPPFQDWNSE